MTEENAAIYEFPNFLTPEECAAFSRLVTEKEAPNFTDSGLFTNKKWQDPALATALFDRLEGRVEGALRANTVVMGAIFHPRDSFSIHTDTGLYYDRARGEKSRWTMLIYLNDDFEGGDTVFYDTDTWAITRRVRPEAGKALVFDIDLWHSGSPILAGVKRWIGCELIGTMTPLAGATITGPAALTPTPLTGHRESH